MLIPRALAQSSFRHLHLRAPRLLRQHYHHKPQPEKQEQQEKQQQQQQGGEQGADRGSALPAPGQGEPITLDVSGGQSTVKLGQLGPLVINADGTTGRVNNWDEMTPMERETTLRLLSKRNKARLEALKAKGGPAENSGDGSA